MVGEECDVVTGECECREGVGGLDCSYCLPGLFDYSIDNGCIGEHYLEHMEGMWVSEFFSDSLWVW